MENSFLDVARQGRNSFWHYFVSFSLAIGAWLTCGGLIAMIGMAEMVQNGNSPLDTTAQMSVLAFSTFMLSFLPWLVATLLGVWLIHGRSPLTLLTPSGRVRWKRLGQGFGLWLALLILVSVVEALLYPGRYRLAFSSAWWRYLLPALLLIPLQTSTEEIFFRGYLLQAFGLRRRDLRWLVVLSGIVFALPHTLNPEVAVNFWLVMASYFVTGAFAAWLTLRDQGLELALGMHAAQNLFVLVANYPNSSLNIPSVFALRELDPLYGVIAQLIAIVIFARLLFPRQRQVANAPVQDESI